MLTAIANGGKVLKPKIVSAILERDMLTEAVWPASLAEVKKQLFMPEVIRSILIHGMCRVTARTCQGSLGNFKRLYQQLPEAIKDYQEMVPYLPGKTSTAESVEYIDLDEKMGTNLYTHVWFGGVAYEDELVNQHQDQFVFHDALGRPELVVVVYLRYGGYGKEAAPVAAQIAKKWKEIKKGNGKNAAAPAKV